jgi:CheY-like chemotaxis protein
MRPFQIPLGISVSPPRVLAALLLLVTAIAAVAWLVTRRARDEEQAEQVDEPLQRLRGFHIFGPDEDGDERTVHVPLIGRRTGLEAPPPPSAPAQPPAAAAAPPARPPAAPPVTRTILPPAAPKPPAANGNGNGTTPHRPSSPRGNGTARPSIDEQLGRDILLVEDDETIAGMYQMMLDAKGYSTRHARDGVEGIAAVRKERPALILLDMMMPRMDGLQFLEALRGWPKTTGIPVVVLSNVADHALVERALGLGAVEYLVKAQTRPQVLLGALPHWLRGNRALTV